MRHPTLIDLHRESVRSDWVDYNGHMNVAYYVLIFDHATDTFLEHIGLDLLHRETTKNSVFVAEAHLTYEKEVLEGDNLRISTQILDADEKRIHIFHRMHMEYGDDLVATNELMILGVNLTTRRVEPFAKELMVNLRSMLENHSGLPSPEQAGRMIGIRRSKK